MKRKIGFIAKIAMIAAVFATSLFSVNAFADGADDVNPRIEPDKPSQCASILTWLCKDTGDGTNETQIYDLIMLVVNIMTAGIGVLATIGIILCGYTILTARDNEAQVTKAKKRLLEIVIGLIAWILGTVVVNLLLPSFTGTVSEPTVSDPTSYNPSSSLISSAHNEVKG